MANKQRYCMTAILYVIWVPCNARLQLLCSNFGTCAPDELVPFPVPLPGRNTQMMCLQNLHWPLFIYMLGLRDNMNGFMDTRKLPYSIISTVDFSAAAHVVSITPV